MHDYSRHRTLKDMSPAYYTRGTPIQFHDSMPAGSGLEILRQPEEFWATRMPSIHPLASIGFACIVDAARVDKFARLQDEVVLEPGSAVGEEVILGGRVRVQYGARVDDHAVLGAKTWVGPGAVVGPGIHLRGGLVVPRNARVSSQPLFLWAEAWTSNGNHGRPGGWVWDVSPGLYAYKNDSGDADWWRRRIRDGVPGRADLSPAIVRAIDAIDAARAVLSRPAQGYTVTYS